MKKVKWIVIFIALVVVAGAFTFLWLSRPTTPPVPKIEVVVDQGEEVKLPPTSAEIDQIVVKTETTVQPLPEDEKGRPIQPQKAIIKQETDSKGNTRLEILTPVYPAPKPSLDVEIVEFEPPEEEEENETQPNPPIHTNAKIDKGEEWYVVKTEVVIPAPERPRWKPILMLSEDGLEGGFAYEFIRLDKVTWLSEHFEGVSFDAVFSVYRAGVGISKDFTEHINSGVAITLDWSDFVKLKQDPELESEFVIYAGWQF